MYSITTLTGSILMTVGSLSLDSNITEVEHIIDNFFVNINSAHYNASQFILNLVFLLICFGLKYSLYFKVVDIDTNTDEGKRLKDRYKNYVFIHLGLSYAFALLICYILVKLSNAADIVIIWNVVIAPLIGFLASIWFNNEILVKYEDTYKFLKNPLTEEDKKESSSKEKKSDNNHNEININITNGDNNSTDDKFVLQGDEELTDSKRIEVTINRIIEVQREQSVVLEQHTRELQDQNQMLKNMQSLLKNNIKFELEDMIYSVLNRGYVTPAEDKRIRIKYKDYTSNNGNGDLEELYKTRYLDLDCHEHTTTR